MDPRFPTGQFTFVPTPSPAQRTAWVDAIGSLPAEFKSVFAALAPEKLDMPYRDGGWTARQVVHHVADSHMNAYLRFKLALTETNPTIKPYEQAMWAELVDGKTADPAVSLAILDGVHHRLHLVLRSLAPSEFARTAVHPEHGPISIDWLLQMYAWHGRHHKGHLQIVGGR
jgi:DinB superfamily